VASAGGMASSSSAPQLGLSIKKKSPSELLTMADEILRERGISVSQARSLSGPRAQLNHLKKLHSKKR
jgi:hypothetical protein